MKDRRHGSVRGMHGKGGEEAVSQPSFSGEWNTNGRIVTGMRLVLCIVSLLMLPPSTTPAWSAEEHHGFWLSPNLRLVKPAFVDQQDFTGLTEDQRNTLLSIRLIEGTTTYMMTYYGSYGDEEAWSTATAGREPDSERIHCSTFSARTSGGQPVFAYNNDNAGADWMAVILCKPPDGFASVCISSSRFCRVHEYAMDCSDRALRNHVLTAPRYSFDGINEHGLTMSPMGLFNRPIVYDPGKRTLHGLTTICMVLRSCRDVFEAIDKMRQYNNSMSDQIHYLLSDAFGNSAVVEYDSAGQDGLLVSWRSGPFQICTNEIVYGHQNDPSYWAYRCDRYYHLLGSLSGRSGVVSEGEATELLRQIAPTPGIDSRSVRTVWSSVYNTTTGLWRLILDRNWSSVFRLRMPMMADLALDDIAFASDSVAVGEKTQIVAHVRNAGIRPTRPAKIHCYLSRTKKITTDSVLIASYSAPALVAAGRYTVSRNYRIGTDLEPGMYFLIAAVDSEGRNNDPDRSNNVVVSEKRCHITAPE